VSSTVRISVSLDAVDDHALLAWLKQQPNQSATVRLALSEHMNGPSNAEIKAAVDTVMGLVNQVLLKLQHLGTGDLPQDVEVLVQETQEGRNNLESMIERWKR
jgi:hypothetical protein